MADLRNVPWSPEAEKAVMGALLLSDGAFESIADCLRAEDFLFRPHRVVFEAVAELAAQGRPRDVVTVYEHLAAREQAEDIGGLAFVGGLANEAGSAANIRAYAEIVRARSLYRQLIGVATDVMDSLYDRQDMPVSEQLDYAESRLLEVHNLIEGGAQQGPVVMREAYEQALHSINELADRGTTLTGVDTGLRDLNRMTAGLQPGNLIVIAGRPAMGKTALATQISGQAAVRGGGCALFFSLEMPANELVQRLMSQFEGVQLERLKQPKKLTDEDWDRLGKGQHLPAANYWIDDSHSITLTQIRTRARRLHRKHRLSVIVIDYVQLVTAKAGRKDITRDREVGEISRGLKGLAKELGVPIIVLSQLNRECERRADKRPMMSDLRESGSLEQDADLAILCYRDEVYHPKGPHKGVAELIIGKQRSGPTGTAEATWYGPRALYSDLAGPNREERERLHSGGPSQGRGHDWGEG